MAQVLNTNLASIRAQNSLERSNNAMQVALDRLSSGNRINSAKDDAAGLAITNRFSSQIRGLEQATRNANDAISVAQIAEGAMTEMNDILQRIREIAVQSANGSNTSNDRVSLNDESNELIQELDRIANSIDFNGTKILNGELSNKLFQIGYQANDTVAVSVKDSRTNALGSNKLDLFNLSNSIVNALDGDLDGTESYISTQTITISGTASLELDVPARSSMKDLATSINSVTGSTGVTATAKNVVRLDNLTADGQVSFNLYGDNNASASSVQVSADVTSSDLTNLKNAINNRTGSTGIIADFVNGSDKSGLILTHATGEDIGIENFASSASNEDVSLRVTSYADTEFYSKELDAIATNNQNVAPELSDVSGNLVINNKTYNLGSGFDSASEVAGELNTKIASEDGIRAKAYTEVRFTYDANGVAGNFQATDGEGVASGYNATGVTFTSVQDFVDKFNTNFKDSLEDLRATVVSGNTVALISETGKNILIDGDDTTDLTVTNWSNGSAGSSTTLDASDANLDSGAFRGTVFLESDKAFTVNSADANYTSSTGSASTTEAYSSNRHQFLVNDDVTGGDQNDSVTIRGDLSLVSNKSFSISSSNAGNNLTPENSIIAKTDSVADSSELDSIANVDLSTSEDAQKAILTIDGAIQMLSMNRAELGSKQQRFSHAINSMSDSIENVSAARSRVMDADYAKETAAMIKNQILQQAGVSVLAQANQMPQNILKLLG